MSRLSKNTAKTGTKLKDREAPQARRLGKRTAAESRETRRALLKAAADAFAEHGYAGAKLDAIAEKAGVTKGAIYSHFNGREDLLVQACQSALREMNLFKVAAEAPDIQTFINETTKVIIAPDSRAIRMLNIEVHLSATRSEVMARLLAEWHAEGFATLKDRLSPELGTPEAVFAMIHVIHLGLSHIDALNSLNADQSELRELAFRLVSTLVSTGPT